MYANLNVSRFSLKGEGTEAANATPDQRTEMRSYLTEAERSGEDDEADEEKSAPTNHAGEATREFLGPPPAMAPSKTRGMEEGIPRNANNAQLPFPSRTLAHMSSTLSLARLLGGKDKAAREQERKRRSPKIPADAPVASLEERQHFCLELARALLATGAPSHRIEAQLECVARKLQIEATFVYLPGSVLVSLGDENNRSSRVETVNATTKLAVGKIHVLHKLYRRVLGNKISVKAANESLRAVLKAPPEYSAKFRLILAFACSALICPMSFGGSFLDMLMSGLGGALLCFMQFFFIVKHPMYASVFELSVAFIMSFFARALSIIPGHFFCYSAISSGATVLILPGYIILCSALELGSKNMNAGSIRLVYAIIYSLLLGVGLTLGSDLYFVLDPRARRLQQEVINLQELVKINGTFLADNFPGYELHGTFGFTQAAKEFLPPLKGCLREPTWPWYKRPFPFWTIFLLVPAYCTFASLWKGQPINRHLPVMVLFACCSYAANRVAKQYIEDRSDVTSAVGAFVLGLLGNTYSRVFKGTAFTSMITGVVFLVPSSLGYGGGLSFSGDLYTESIMLGFRMVQIAIGVTVGLFTSALVVYSFGSKKNAAIFAF